MQDFILRPYQRKAESDLRSAHVAGHRQIVWVGATGAGKTVIISSIVKKAISKKNRVWALEAHKLLPDIVIVDECHHQVSPTYMRIISRILSAKKDAEVT